MAWLGSEPYSWRVARSKTLAKVGRRSVELSNLDKVLFPEARIVKAELIAYYVAVAPTMLRHIKGRPLSLLRLPDGLGGQVFFQKNTPEWAPDWVETVTLGGKHYVTATEPATLAWLANMACIELHQMPSRRHRPEKADYVVWDLDPPEGYDFRRVVGLAFGLREMLEREGYHPFVKTTGGKGVHVVAPIQPKWGFDEVSDAAEAIARRFATARRDEVTLSIRKEARRGRVFLDILRNKPSQTIVCPYSARAREGAPVSMPVTWEVLEDLLSPAELTIGTAPDWLETTGDVWENFDAYAVPLHTARRSASRAAPTRGTPKVVELAEYARKREFSKTPEPPAEGGTAGGDRFVVQRHHATRLHYDLRLERDGVLESWAVPKGLPSRPGIRHMAVRTEDHPVKYLTFEGEIPKGEYGGGTMWLFASGRYEITKAKKDSFYFRLASPELSAEYRLINTKGKDWFVERVDEVQVDWTRRFTAPMKLESRREPFDSPEWAYEVKWDGVRAVVAVDEGAVRIWSRTGQEMTAQFPEIVDGAARAVRAASAVYDAEIVCLDPQGRPVFQDVMKRVLRRGDASVAAARSRLPAVLYVFDCLYLDGRPIVDEPWERRRAWMIDSLETDDTWRVSEEMPSGRKLFTAARNLGLEGIVAKRRASRYTPGRRSADWVKIKARTTAECVVLGYTAGEGARGADFGALRLGAYENGRLRYVGKTGTGFSDRERGQLLAELGQRPPLDRPTAVAAPADPDTVWVEPTLVCEVQFSSRTRGGQLRDPVFLRMRPDVAPEECIIG